MRQNLLFAALAVALGSASSVAFADVNTIVGGRMFLDFSNIDQSSKGVDTDNKGFGFDVKRFYLTLDHKFDDQWSANLTTDFNYQSSLGQTSLFVKKAYVQYKFNKDTSLRVGASDTPWIPYAESFYGYRYIEATITDRLKFGNSSDWGAHLAGGGTGMLTYAVAVVDGAGYKNFKRSKGVDLEARVGVQPIDGLVFALGGYTGDRAQDVSSAPSKHTATRWDALAAYKTGAFRIGAEFFTADNWNNVATVATDKASGYSVFGDFKFAKDYAVFARYDNTDTSKTLDPTLRDEYYHLGVEWAVRKGVKLAGVFKHYTLQNDRLPTASGYKNDETNEIGIFGDIAF